MRFMRRRSDFPRTADAALAAFGIGLRQAFAAWPVLMGRALFYLVVMAILAALWDKVTAAHLPGTLAAHLPEGALTLYVGVTEWITLSVSAIHLRLEDDIRSGALEPQLLRPKPYLAQRISESLGGAAARLIVLAIAGIALLVLSGRPQPPLLAFMYVAVLGVLGCAIGVLLFTFAGLSAFWIRRVLPPYLIVQKLTFLLGGLFAPISLYPRWLFRFALATPFAAHTFFAGVQIIAPSERFFFFGIGLEVLWIIALSALIALLWRRGLARLLREGSP